jgi:hypothetical protein
MIIIGFSNININADMVTCQLQWFELPAKNTQFESILNI